MPGPAAPFAAGIIRDIDLMSHAYPNRLAGLALGVLTAATALPALAADLDYPYPDPSDVYREERVERHLPPAPPPVYRPRFTARPGYAPPPREACQTAVTHRIDEDGDEFERRVSVCDEAPDHPPPVRPSFHGSLPPDDVPDGRW